jgi:hypothetical protein
MREFDHDEQPDQAAPRRRPAEEADLGQLARAAAAGRPDVLGHTGLVHLQRAVGNSAVGTALQRAEEDEAASPVHDVVSSGGAPLDTGTRADMEGRFGTDFGDVRVHTGGAAEESAKSVGAHAYTVGSNVVFQRDRYDPGSDAGRTMLAHELTHVVQQRSGPVDGTPAAGGIKVSDPSDRFEREAVANAERITAMPAQGALQRDAAAPAAQPAVQRAEAPAEEEEEAVQGSFEHAAPVQRAEDEEMEEEG